MCTRLWFMFVRSGGRSSAAMAPSVASGTRSVGRCQPRPAALLVSFLLTVGRPYSNSEKLYVLGHMWRWGLEWLEIGDLFKI